MREITFKLIQRIYPHKCSVKRLKNDINTNCCFCLENLETSTSKALTRARSHCPLPTDPARHELFAGSEGQQEVLLVSHRSSQAEKVVALTTTATRMASQQRKR